jgi:hypothetical protein
MRSARALLSSSSAASSSSAGAGAAVRAAPARAPAYDVSEAARRWAALPSTLERVVAIRKECAPPLPSSSSTASPAPSPPAPRKPAAAPAPAPPPRLDLVLSHMATLRHGAAEPVRTALAPAFAMLLAEPGMLSQIAALPPLDPSPSKPSAAALANSLRSYRPSAFSPSAMTSIVSATTARLVEGGVVPWRGGGESLGAWALAWQLTGSKGLLPLHPALLDEAARGALAELAGPDGASLTAPDPASCLAALRVTAIDWSHTLHALAAVGEREAMGAVGRRLLACAAASKTNADVRKAFDAWISRPGAFGALARASRHAVYAGCSPSDVLVWLRLIGSSGGGGGGGGRGGGQGGPRGVLRGEEERANAPQLLLPVLRVLAADAAVEGSLTPADLAVLGECLEPLDRAFRDLWQLRLSGHLAAALRKLADASTSIQGMGLGAGASSGTVSPAALRSLNRMEVDAMSRFLLIGGGAPAASAATPAAALAGGPAAYRLLEKKAGQLEAAVGDAMVILRDLTFLRGRSQAAPLLLAPLPSLAEGAGVLTRLIEDGRWSWRGGAGKDTSAAEEAFASALESGYAAAVRGELPLSSPAAREALRAAGPPARKTRVPAPGGVESFELDVAFGAGTGAGSGAQVAVEIDGPSHFVPFSGRELVDGLGLGRGAEPAVHHAASFYSPGNPLLARVTRAVAAAGGDGVWAARRTYAHRARAAQLGAAGWEVVSVPYSARGEGAGGGGGGEGKGAGRGGTSSAADTAVRGVLEAVAAAAAAAAGGRGAAKTAKTT